MLGLTKKRQAETTAFSTFIRNASSAEKKRVYERVLTKASERQNETVRRAGVERHATC
ncbi:MULTISPECIES: hypothetical protein [Halomonas]|uniref:Uncharacterized protein n=1 Tax=Halomonas elongata (strain ATCC 33173 / DSM 2581 / NBRC 15536 / NCIMB 2198 / 1H9) TaxID=768066 RepID=A0A1R4A466_HALED|nr:MULTISPECIES: hypothetical protein [Halomonas]WBF19243.1 hypothetical protein LM502_06010 [Halomonas elongata]WPU48103.1 hypothetical protein SR933_04235 [Halomonas elongata DSM 2581]SJK83761.1 uncharacterized protein HELO_2105B [Halomonas elongata DSM 2581]